MCISTSSLFSHLSLNVVVMLFLGLSVRLLFGYELEAIVETENAVTLKGLLYCNTLFFKDILKRIMWTTFI